METAQFLLDVEQRKAVKGKPSAPTGQAVVTTNLQNKNSLILSGTTYMLSE